MFYLRKSQGTSINLTREPVAHMIPLSSYQHPRSVYKKVSIRSLVKEFSADFLACDGDITFDNGCAVVETTVPFEHSGFSNHCDHKACYTLRLPDAEVYGDKMYIVTDEGVVKESVFRFEHLPVAQMSEDPNVVQPEG